MIIVFIFCLVLSFIQYWFEYNSDFFQYAFFVFPIKVIEMKFWILSLFVCDCITSLLFKLYWIEFHIDINENGSFGVWNGFKCGNYMFFGFCFLVYINIFLISDILFVFVLKNKIMESNCAILVHLTFGYKTAVITFSFVQRNT